MRWFLFSCYCFRRQQRQRVAISAVPFRFLVDRERRSSSRVERKDSSNRFPCSCCDLIGSVQIFSKAKARECPRLETLRVSKRERKGQTRSVGRLEIVEVVRRHFWRILVEIQGVSPQDLPESLCSLRIFPRVVGRSCQVPKLCTSGANTVRREQIRAPQSSEWPTEVRSCFVVLLWS